MVKSEHPRSFSPKPADTPVCIDRKHLSAHVDVLMLKNTSEEEEGGPAFLSRYHAVLAVQ
jgi:hypothetical protein